MAIKSLKSGLSTRSAMAGNSIIMPGSYESIATTTVGAGGTASVTFSSIPSTYSHLQVRILCRTNYPASDTRNLTMRFNSDTASNYSDHYLLGDGASVSSGADTTVSEMYIGTATGATAASNVFAVNIIDVLDYANTNKYKTVRNIHGLDLNGSGRVLLRSGSWRSTSAVTSISFDLEGNWDFNQYSHFALYGVN